jgi:hypothetical protein
LGRRVRRDKEDPSCTEWGLLNVFNVLYKCPLVVCVNIINVVKPSSTVIPLSCLFICFRRLNHMAINHLHSSSAVRHRHVWHKNIFGNLWIFWGHIILHTRICTRNPQQVLDQYTPDLFCTSLWIIDTALYHHSKYFYFI